MGQTHGHESDIPMSFYLLHRAISKCWQGHNTLLSQMAKGNLAESEDVWGEEVLRLFDFSSRGPGECTISPFDHFTFILSSCQTSAQAQVESFIMKYTVGVPR